MIKREYTYFVAYQIQNGDVRRHCHAVITRYSKVENNNGLLGMINTITSNCNENNIECTKVIFTSITLLSSKWVWK